MKEYRFNSLCSVLLSVIAVGVLLVGCGGSDKGGTGNTSGSTSSSGGTVRLSSGQMKTVIGQLVNDVGASFTPQTVTLLESGGKTETIPNVLTNETLAANSKVILLRQGSQPVVATFTDTTNLFYSNGQDNTLLPIDTTGKTQTGYLKSVDDSVYHFSSRSPLTVGGVTVTEISFRVSTSNEAIPLGSNPMAFPMSFYVDLPKAGKSLSSAGGKLSYDPAFTLQTYRVEVGLPDGGNYATASGTMQTNASASLKFQVDDPTAPLSTGTFGHLTFSVGP